jgi:hypothetical protein
MHSAFSDFISHLQSAYPHVDAGVVAHLTPNIVSPFKIKLPQRVFDQAKTIVAELHQLTQSSAYMEIIKKNFPYTRFQKTPSLLCSLDAHLMPGGQLKIIEVNTNASSYLINVANYYSRQIPTFPNAKQHLVQNFKRAFAYNLNKDGLLVITDDNPPAQHMYVEFLMYKELLERELQIRVQIADVNELSTDADGTVILNGEKVDAVYNRHTDFYFANTPSLRQAFAESRTAISPNPWGYALLADKRRMMMWSPEFFKNLQEQESLKFVELPKALLTTKKFADFKSHEDLWVQRANYFFKPANSHGGKAVYKGKSISRSTFQNIYNGEYLAQEAATPPELELRHEGIEYDFKYDLRFYFFEGEIHLAAARLYQGQMTNMQTAFGGLTPLEIVE